MGIFPKIEVKIKQKLKPPPRKMFELPPAAWYRMGSQISDTWLGSFRSHLCRLEGVPQPDLGDKSDHHDY